MQRLWSELDAYAPYARGAVYLISSVIVCATTFFCVRGPAPALGLVCHLLDDILFAGWIHRGIADTELCFHLEGVRETQPSCRRLFTKGLVAAVSCDVRVGGVGGVVVVAVVVVGVVRVVVSCRNIIRVILVFSRPSHPFLQVLAL
jgi:hypothetical protein